MNKKVNSKIHKIYDNRLAVLMYKLTTRKRHLVAHIYGNLHI